MPPLCDSTRNKSLFASFSSEKEESSFFEKKKQKNFIPTLRTRNAHPTP
jgi:hypothetical protein